MTGVVLDCIPDPCCLPYLSKGLEFQIQFFSMLHIFNDNLSKVIYIQILSMLHRFNDIWLRSSMFYNVLHFSHEYFKLKN